MSAPHDPYSTGYAMQNTEWGRFKKKLNTKLTLYAIKILSSIMWSELIMAPAIELITTAVLCGLLQKMFLL